VKCCTVLGHCDGVFLEHLFYRISIAQLALTFCWILQFCCRKVNISCDLKPYNQIYINNCPTRCNTKQSIYYSASSFYMFRVSTTPIIRCIQNCKTVTTASGTGHIFCAAPTWPLVATLLFCKFTLHVSGVNHTHHQVYTKLQNCNYSLRYWSYFLCSSNVATCGHVIILQVHSTCFGCQPHPSSGVYKTAKL